MNKYNKILSKLSGIPTDKIGSGKTRFGVDGLRITASQKCVPMIFEMNPDSIKNLGRNLIL